MVLVYIYVIPSIRQPSRFILSAVFTYRLISAPHFLHIHTRPDNASSLFISPHVWHVLLDGYHLSITINCLPCSASLYPRKVKPLSLVISPDSSTELYLSCSGLLLQLLHKHWLSALIFYAGSPFVDSLSFHVIWLPSVSASPCFYLSFFGWPLNNTCTCSFSRFHFITV